MSGIYAIVNTHNGMRYVGQSINMPTRLREHRNKLRKGKHENSYLQKAWNKYGEAAFAFTVVLEVPLTAEQIANGNLPGRIGPLTLFEQFELDHDFEVSYNIRSVAELPPRLSYEQLRKCGLALNASTTREERSERGRKAAAVTNALLTAAERSANGRKGAAAAHASTTIEQKRSWVKAARSTMTRQQIRDNSRKGAHVQWHVNRNLVNPKCALCVV